jgi:hypothetical protein
MNNICIYYDIIIIFVWLLYQTFLFDYYISPGNKHVFPDGFCDQTLDTFEKLKNYGIDTNDHYKFFDHFIVYDFETILSKSGIQKTENLSHTNKYIPVFFLLFSLMIGNDVKPIHVVNNDPKLLIESFVSNLREISEQSYEINVQKYK